MWWLWAVAGAAAVVGIQKVYAYIWLSYLSWKGHSEELQGAWEASKTVPFWLKWRLAHNQLFCCLICFGKLGEAIEVDHRLPRHLYPTLLSVKNLRVVHPECHRVKTSAFDLQ